MSSNIPIVSVIVPVYNVEKYIQPCILSILKQTYSHLEIILVDDGSTDKSPRIIDELANKYSKLVVIHQANAGVSAARNAGIQRATGDYVVFVDGDDYLAPDFVEYMLNLTIKTQSPFCLSLHCYTKKTEQQFPTEKVKVLTSEEATALLLSNQLEIGCWNKIYKRSLLVQHGCYFPTDLFYGEGLYFVTQVAQLARTVGVGNRKVYYYRKNNTKSATSAFNIKKIYNGEKSLNRIAEHLSCSNDKVASMLLLSRCLFYKGALLSLQESNLVGKYKTDYKKYRSVLRKNYIKILLNRRISFYYKISILFCCLSPYLYSYLSVRKHKYIIYESV